MTKIDPNTEITNVTFTLQDLVNEFKVSLEYADEISNEFAGRLESMLIEYGWDMLRVIMQDYVQDGDSDES